MFTAPSTGTLEKEQVGQLALLDIKTYYKAMLTKTAWYYCKDHETNSIEQNPEIDSHTYGHLIHHTGVNAER